MGRRRNTSKKAKIDNSVVTASKQPVYVQTPGLTVGHILKPILGLAFVMLLIYLWVFRKLEPFPIGTKTGACDAFKLAAGDLSSDTRVVVIGEQHGTSYPLLCINDLLLTTLSHYLKEGYTVLIEGTNVDLNTFWRQAEIRLGLTNSVAKFLCTQPKQKCFGWDNPKALEKLQPFRKDILRRERAGLLTPESSKEAQDFMYSFHPVRNQALVRTIKKHPRNTFVIAGYSHVDPGAATQVEQDHGYKFTEKQIAETGRVKRALDKEGINYAILTPDK